MKMIELFNLTNNYSIFAKFLEYFSIVKFCTDNFFADKAHRRKQGDGVVTYDEPLLRSNAVCEKI